MERYGPTKAELRLRLSDLHWAYASGWLCAVAAIHVASVLKGLVLSPPLQWLNVLPTLPLGAALGATAFGAVRRQVSPLSLLCLSVLAVGVLATLHGSAVEAAHWSAELAFHAASFGIFTFALSALVESLGPGLARARKAILGSVVALLALVLLGAAGRCLIDPFGEERLLRTLPMGPRIRELWSSHYYLLWSWLPLFCLGITPAFFAKSTSAEPMDAHSLIGRGARWLALVLVLPLLSVPTLFLTGGAWCEFSSGPWSLEREAARSHMARPMRDMLRLIKHGKPELIMEFADEPLLGELRALDWTATDHRSRLGRDLKSLSTGRATYESLRQCEPRHPPHTAIVQTYDSSARASNWVEFTRNPVNREPGWYVSRLRVNDDESFRHHCGSK